MIASVVAVKTEKKKYIFSISFIYEGPRGWFWDGLLTLTSVAGASVVKWPLWSSDGI